MVGVDAPFLPNRRIAEDDDDAIDDDVEVEEREEAEKEAGQVA